MSRGLFTALLCIEFASHAQSVSTLMGARAAGMGYASSVLTDEASQFNNPGATGYEVQSSSFFAFETTPSLPGANRMAAGITAPSKVGVVTAGIFRFGDALYSEQIAGASFANHFGISALGIRANLIQYEAAGFGTQQALSLSFGGLTRITPQISAGAYIINLNQPRLSPDEHLPTKLVAGFGFALSDQCFVSSEVEKDIDYPVSWRTGAEYTIHKKVFVRTGVCLNPLTGSFGLGAKSGPLKIDCAMTFHHVTGATCQASAAYQFSHKPGK